MTLPGISGLAGLQAGAAGGGGGFTAVAAPDTVSKTQGSFGPGALVLTTPASTVTPSGGVAPYTYSCARVSGDATVAATAPATASSAFTSSVALGVTEEAIFRWTVTDANGAVAVSNDVYVTLDHVDLR